MRKLFIMKFPSPVAVKWLAEFLGAELVGELLVRASIDKAGKDWTLPITKEALVLLRAEALRAPARGPSDRLFDLELGSLDKVREVGVGEGGVLERGRSELGVGSRSDGPLSEGGTQTGEQVA